MQINHANLAGLTGQVCSISEGAAGTHQTTQMMAQIVAAWQYSPSMRATAINLVQLQAPKDEPAEIRALFDFVKYSIRYVGDVAGVETLQTPDKTLALRAGDCDDKAILLATLLRTIKYPAAFIVAGYTTPGVFEHVYVAIPQPDGSYLAMDPTEEQPLGWEPAGAVDWYMQSIPS